MQVLSFTGGQSAAAPDRARVAPAGKSTLESAARASISVVIPAYNAAAFLPATLASVFAQTESPVEVIVVDDGSTDDTAAVARSCGAAVIVVGNGGCSVARNIGTRAACGEYIAYMDADDIWAPEKLAVQLAALRAYGRPAFSFTDHRIFDEAGVYAVRSGLLAHPAFRRTVGLARYRPTIVIAADATRPVLSDMYFLPASALVRRADALTIGGFDESLSGCEDYEFFLRLFRLVPAIAVMQPLLYYRRHAAQITASGLRVIEREFQVERRVAAAPDRYPDADATSVSRKASLLNYRAGVCLARLGDFDQAIAFLDKSLAERRTLRALAVLAACRRANSAIGRMIFQSVRAIRRRRRQRRSAGPAWFRQIMSVGVTNPR